MPPVPRALPLLGVLPCSVEGALCQCWWPLKRLGVRTSLPPEQQGGGHRLGVGASAGVALAGVAQLWQAWDPQQPFPHVSNPGPAKRSE